MLTNSPCQYQRKCIVCNHTRDEQNWITAKCESNLSITSIITDRIGRQEVLLPINNNCYNFCIGTGCFSCQIKGLQIKLLNCTNHIWGNCSGYKFVSFWQTSHFFLHNPKETLEAVHRLSTCLNIQPSAFSYAGIKDKKAVTKQYMVVRGVSPEQWVIPVLLFFKILLFFFNRIR